MTVCTLLLIVRDGSILLAMKKRGFGSGRWNGIGGKVEPDESIEEALVRESIEEIGVKPLAYDKVAIHDFVFPEGIPDIQVHTFVADEWSGDPTETDEMAPQWFKYADIPYDEMWQDDLLWLPLVLRGRRLLTRFAFDAHESMTQAQLRIVDKVD